MNELMITNNPAVYKKFTGCIEVVYLENDDLLGVLSYTRDKIHLGHRLLTHPLSGSVKPGQTLYKSVLITKEKGMLDLGSLKIIEESCEIACEQIKPGKSRRIHDEYLEDFQDIDLALIASGTMNVLSEVRI